MKNTEQIVEYQTPETNDNIPMPAILKKLVNDMLDRFYNFSNINKIFDDYAFGFEIDKIEKLTENEIYNRVVSFLRLYTVAEKQFEEVLSSRSPIHLPYSFDWRFIDLFLLKDNPNITEKVHKLTLIKMEYLYWYIPSKKNLMLNNYQEVRKEYPNTIIEAYQAW